MQVPLTDEQIEQFLRHLMGECQKKDSYSFKEVIGRMGYDYEQIISAVESHKYWPKIFENCRSSCSTNAELAALKSKIDHTTYHRYAMEGDDDYIEFFRTTGRFLPEYAELVTNRDEEYGTRQINITFLRTTQKSKMRKKQCQKRKT